MFRVTALLLCSWSCAALTLQTEANPIRKVVTLLQDMQKELEVEGQKEQEMFDKLMCYCDGNTDGMGKSAEDAAQKITELKSKLEAEKAEKSQLDQALISHKKDREAATADLSAAEQIREGEHAEYVEATGGAKDNLDAMNAAVAALEKGMGKTFLQSQSTQASRLQKVVQSVTSVDDYERGMVMDFLQGKQNPYGDYSAQSGEIVGILKAMRDEMDKDLNGAVEAEDKSAAGFAELAGAKKDEIAAASSAIETKTQRSGELAVSVVTTADDIEDTTKELADMQAFLANLASMCATKKKEWDERCKVRVQEVSAISEAIKILNDDDALDLFKKTLAMDQQTTLAKKFGLLQKTTGVSVAKRAGALLSALDGRTTHKQQLELIEFSLRNRQVDFSKVLKMIDGMEQVLHEDQKNDDTQKAFCDKDLEASASSKKEAEEAIAAGEAFIEETTAESEATAAEIVSLQKEIKTLDKAVSEATEQRKEEHADFLVFSQQSSAAVQLIEKAKNRLTKFYRPKMYKEPPKAELSEEEQILQASGFNSPAMFVQFRIKAFDTPPPPPETWGAYQKKDGKSNGVMALMDMLTKELKGDIVEAEHTEETSQKDYERLMADSTETRAQNVKSITDKEDAKSDMDTKIEQAKSKKASDEITLADVKQYLAQLHASCDFLIENYDTRKAARETELASLANGRSVLSGSSFE